MNDNIITLLISGIGLSFLHLTDKEYRMNGADDLHKETIEDVQRAIDFLSKYKRYQLVVSNIERKGSPLRPTHNSAIYNAERNPTYIIYINYNYINFETEGGYWTDGIQVRYIGSEDQVIDYIKEQLINNDIEINLINS
jgi:hypothetical protein